MLTEYFPTIALTITFLCVLPFGKSVWIKTDAFISMIFGGTCVFFPYYFLNNQVNGRLDDVHLHIYQLFGIVIISTSLFAFASSGSKDKGVQTAILWGRVIGCSLYLLCRTQSVLHARKGVIFNHHAVHFGIYGNVLWLLGNLIHAFNSTDWNGVTALPKGLNIHLTIDFVETFLLAFLLYVFPGLSFSIQTKDKLQGMHGTLLRMLAAFLFNSAVLSVRALNFTREEDKLSIIMWRLISNAVLVSLQFYSHVTTDLWTQYHLLFGIFGLGAWSVNAAVAFLRFKDISVQTKED